MILAESSSAAGLGTPGGPPEIAHIPTDDLPLTVIERRPGWRILNVREMWRGREVLYYLAWRNIKVRYKQTALGIVWAFAQPLFAMLVFTLFLGNVAGLGEGVEHYALFVLAGMLPFHAELTGRENIFLNGSILGMTRREIKSKFDEIVAFADMAQFLDTPVKRYSSGMFVRLAFAIAAHLQPEVLVVDEVLAVGDAPFQRKCLGKMQDVSREGRTVLFVSHDMTAVRRLCTRAVLLSQERVAAVGPTADVVNEYLARESVLTAPGVSIDLRSVRRQGSQAVSFAELTFDGGAGSAPVFSGGPLHARLSIDAKGPMIADSLALVISDRTGYRLINADIVRLDRPLSLQSGSNAVELTIRALNLQPGNYTLGLLIGRWPETVYDVIDTVCDMEVVPNPLDGSVRPRSDGGRALRVGIVRPDARRRIGPVLKLGLMLLITGVGVAGGLIYAPFFPAAVYYGFAVLRPQFIWGDSLNVYVSPDFPWSMILALAAIGAALVARISVWVAPKRFANIALPRLNAGHVLLGVFAVWVTLSYVNALRPSVARPFYEDYRKILLMFFVTSLVMVSVRQVWLLYLVVLFPLMYIAFEVNEIYLLNGRYNFIYRRGFAGLDNNGAALLLSMGVPPCVYAWDGVKHWIRWVFPVGIALIVHAVLLSYSRGAMFALLLTTPLYLIRARHKKMIVAGYIAALLLAPVLVGEQIAARFGTISESEKDASAQNRFTTWEIAWRMANERPFFDYGIRNSSEFTHNYGADEQGRVIHSTFLQIAADSELVGLATYLAFLAGAFYCANRARMAARTRLTTDANGRDDRLAYAAACGAEGSLAVFVVGGAFLSLETFEPPYIVALIAIQLWSILKMKNGQKEFEGLPTE